MNTKQAFRIIRDVAQRFDVDALVNEEYKKLRSTGLQEDELICKLGACVGLSKRDLEMGTQSLPNRIYKQYPVFGLLPMWDFSQHLSGRNGPARALKAIFRDKTNINVSTREEEQQMILASVGPRCEAKARKINELFPNTFPLDLPVHRFFVSSDEFINFDQVKELCTSYDLIVERFSELFFADIQEDLPEATSLELNLMGTFLNATDIMLPGQRACHNYIQKYRQVLQHESYTHITDYVRIHRTIPVWKAREFYQDRAFAVNYVEKHPECKHLIREFLQKVSSYSCRYIFIKDIEAHMREQKRPEDMSEWTNQDWDDFESEEDPAYITSDSIFISKDNREISEMDRLIVEAGQAMVSSHFYGGAKIRIRNNAWNSERFNRRLSVSISHQNRQMSIPSAAMHPENTTSKVSRETGESNE